jgi:protein-tyrosine-phosphatase/DNA-binding transcriptional ArsR family regulator
VAVTTLKTMPTEFLALVADPHRWQLLVELGRSDRRVGELTDLLAKPQNLVSYHLAALRDAGLITCRKSSADQRDTYYRVDLVRCADLFATAGAALHPGLHFRPSLARPEPPGHVGRRAPVLFLCTGNSARSQMAEALLEHLSDGTIRARSAGSHPKALHPNAVAVLAVRGIDISGHSTKPLSRFARTRFDRVITLCDKVREICPEFSGQPTTAHWSMADPAAPGGPLEATLPAFQRCAAELEIRIGQLIAQITDEQQKGRTTHAH